MMVKLLNSTRVSIIIVLIGFCAGSVYAQASFNRGMGDEQAPISITEYIDHQCPACMRFHERYFDRYLQYINEGKIQYQIRFAPIPAHPLAEPEAKTAYCAGEQGEFWTLHLSLLRISIQREQQVFEIAETAGLDMDEFRRCYRSNRPSEQIREDRQKAREYGITSVPGFVVNGKRVDVNVTPDYLQSEYPGVFGEKEAETEPEQGGQKAGAGDAAPQVGEDVDRQLQQSEELTESPEPFRTIPEDSLASFLQSEYRDSIYTNYIQQQKQTDKPLKTEFFVDSTRDRDNTLGQITAGSDGDPVAEQEFYEQYTTIFGGLKAEKDYQAGNIEVRLGGVHNEFLTNRFDNELPRTNRGRLSLNANLDLLDWMDEEVSKDERDQKQSIMQAKIRRIRSLSDAAAIAALSERYLSMDQQWRERIERARSILDGIENVYEEGGIARSRVNRARTAYDQLQTNMNTLQGRLRTASQALPGDKRFDYRIPEQLDLSDTYSLEFKRQRSQFEERRKKQQKEVEPSLNLSTRYRYDHIQGLGEARDQYTVQANFSYPLTGYSSVSNDPEFQLRKRRFEQRRSEARQERQVVQRNYQRRLGRHRGQSSRIEALQSNLESQLASYEEGKSKGVRSLALMAELFSVQLDTYRQAGELLRQYVRRSLQYGTPLEKVLRKIVPRK